jgi:dTDP-glucose 4,6-dehydratase
MHKILITGASGFVGRALLPLLCRAGFNNLLVLDRIRLPSCTRYEVEQAGGSVHELVGDRLPAPQAFPELEYLVCLAGATSVDAALADPRPAIEGNLQIAVDLGEWARASEYPVRIIYVSSDEVLGEAFDPLPASAVIHPTQPYAASKAAAEIILHCYRDVYKLHIATVRSCNLIGPGQRAPKLLPVAVQALLMGEPVPIHGSGEQKREWMAVKDFAQAILTMIQRGAQPRIYQAASGYHLTVLQVVELAAQALNVPLDVKYVVDRVVQDRDYAMDASLLHSLGWYPREDPRIAIGAAASALAGDLQGLRHPIDLRGAS